MAYLMRMLTYIELTMSDWRLCSTTVKKCSPILFPAVGNATCVDTLEPFSFGSQCDFTCPEGYYLRGDSTLTCLASGVWSKPTPTCTGGSQCVQSFYGSIKKEETCRRAWCSDELKCVFTPQLYSATVSRLHLQPLCNVNNLWDCTAMTQCASCNVKKDLI